MAGAPCEKSMQSQPKIHGTNREPTGNGQNLSCLHMISKDADPMSVPVIMFQNNQARFP